LPFFCATHQVTLQGKVMSWDIVLRQLDAAEVVEFGIHQMNEKTGSLKWRRHRGGSMFRFQSLRSALFSPDKGARAACLGKSTYAQANYSVGPTSVVPYVAAWLRGWDLGFLVRAGATDPEVTLVPVHEMDAINSADHAVLLASLARLFGQGAESYGVRHLVSGDVK
jgi:hypothetical protein